MRTIAAILNKTTTTHIFGTVRLYPSEGAHLAFETTLTSPREILTLGGNCGNIQRWFPTTFAIFKGFVTVVL